MLILSPFTCTTALYTLSLHDALPICRSPVLPDLEVRRLSSIVRLVVATLALAHLALLAVLLSEVEEVRGGGRDARVLAVHLGDALLHPLLATGLRRHDVRSEERRVGKAGAARWDG